MPLAIEKISTQPLGEEVEPNSLAAVDVWAQVLDEEGKPSGYVRRKRWRTVREVYNDLNRLIDVYECAKCGDQVSRKEKGEEYPDDLIFGKQKCGKCGQAVYESNLDEYFSIMEPYEYNGSRDYRNPGKMDFPLAGQGRIACWAVTGGSEGHYVHISVLNYDESLRKNIESTVYLFKTFRGMDHAYRMAHRFAELLGC